MVQREKVDRKDIKAEDTMVLRVSDCNILFGKNIFDNLMNIRKALYSMDISMCHQGEMFCFIKIGLSVLLNIFKSARCLYRAI